MLTPLDPPQLAHPDDHAAVAAMKAGVAPPGMTQFPSLDASFVAHVMSVLRDAQVQDLQRMPLMQSELAQHVAEQMGLAVPTGAMDPSMMMGSDGAGMAGIPGPGGALPFDPSMLGGAPGDVSGGY